MQTLKGLVVRHRRFFWKAGVERRESPLRRVIVELPNWIGKEEAQEEVVQNLRSRALLKVEFYRSKMKPFEAKYATTFPRFQRRTARHRKEDFAAWDDLIEREAYYRGYQEWKKRHAELRRWSDR